MIDRSSAARGLSTLTIEFTVLDGRTDWPVADILVDGSNPFASVAPDWHGFDPGAILGPASPLLPVGHGRRVAVCLCSCGIAGCGVIAPVIRQSPDGKTVSWVDFRDYVGVFIEPFEPSAEAEEGRPWSLPDICFDSGQYLAEVRRASTDRSWETPRRRMARLLFDRLRPYSPVLPPDLELAWASPAWSEEGVTVMFERVHQTPGQVPVFRQELLRLTSAQADPERAAEDMAEQLFSTPASEWIRVFGWQSN